MEKLDKSKGFAFEIDLCYLSESVRFYNGLHSSGSYAAEYKGNLIYLSSPSCKCNPEGRIGAAKNRMAAHIIGRIML